MDEWFHIIIRQLILYSLPVLVSLTLVVWIESRLIKTAIPHPFFAIFWRGTWLPLLASLAFHRGIIIALPNPLSSSVKAATIRCLTHALLCLLGFILFSWSLAHPMPTGLPPLHHWWAKVLMFFNLCMVCLHLLPLPSLLLGECLRANSQPHHWPSMLSTRFNVNMGIKHSWIVIMLLAASPILDIALGATVVFPIYEFMNNMATHLFR